jgi:hypothetical protein
MAIFLYGPGFTAAGAWAGACGRIGACAGTELGASAPIVTSAVATIMVGIRRGCRIAESPKIQL